MQSSTNIIKIRQYKVSLFSDNNSLSLYFPVFSLIPGYIHPAHVLLHQPTKQADCLPYISFRCKVLLVQANDSFHYFFSKT